MRPGTSLLSRRGGFAELDDGAAVLDSFTDGFYQNLDLGVLRLDLVHPELSHLVEGHACDGLVTLFHMEAELGIDTVVLQQPLDAQDVLGVVGIKRDLGTSS
jgi:hypothetical protein